MPKLPELQIPVRAYYSPEALAAGDPDWLGTLDSFWHEHRDYSVGQILEIADKLKSRGMATIGADPDALPDFWLVRGGADPAPSPKGWEVAETSVEETPAGRTNADYLLRRCELAERLNGKLMAALERISALGDGVLLGGEYRKEMALIARNALTEIRGR